MSTVDIINIIGVTIIFYLGIQSLFLFWNNKPEKYYLYFALFIITIGLLTSSTSNIAYKIFNITFNRNSRLHLFIDLLLTGIPLDTICYTFPRYLLELNGQYKREKIFERLTIIQISITIFFTPMILILKAEYFRIKLWGFFHPNMLVFIIPILTYIILFYIKLNRKNKMFKTVNLLSHLAILIIILFQLSGSLYFLITGNSLNNIPNYSIPMIIACLLFAYTLAIRVGRDKKELVNLKNTLEKKVETRTAELTEANRRIEEKEQQKTRFFIKLAHETKTPLTLIKNYLDEYLKDTGMNDKLLVVKQNIDKLARDMVHFLDYEKLEKGEMDYNHDQVFNLSAFITDKIDLYKEVYWKRKHILVKTRIEDHLFIKADSVAIDRIINNLADNAYKYSRDEGGIIEIGCKTRKNKILITVKDNGIGIGKEKVAHIFKPYYRAGSALVAANTDGIGMGLYIVSRIVKSIGGTIDVQSVPGEGSLFTITFPVHYVQDGDNIKEKISGTILEPVDGVFKKIRQFPFDEKKPTLLLVEDNPDMLYYLQSQLKEQYNVFFAHNGAEGLKKLKKIPKPNVILSDVMMDRMDGFTFTQYLSKEKDFKDIPVILLTARSNEQDKLQGLASGAVAYLYKPFTIDELKAQLRSVHKHTLNVLSAKKSSNFDILFTEKCNEAALTPKEKETLGLILQGKEVKEISSLMDISSNTVNTHIRHLFKKFNVNNKMGLISLFR